MHVLYHIGVRVGSAPGGLFISCQAATDVDAFFDQKPGGKFPKSARFPGGNFGKNDQDHGGKVGKNDRFYGGKVALPHPPPSIIHTIITKDYAMVL